MKKKKLYFIFGRFQSKLKIESVLIYEWHVSAFFSPLCFAQAHWDAIEPEAPSITRASSLWLAASSEVTAPVGWDHRWNDTVGKPSASNGRRGSVHKRSTSQPDSQDARTQSDIHSSPSFQSRSHEEEPRLQLVGQRAGRDGGGGEGERGWGRVRFFFYFFLFFLQRKKKIHKIKKNEKYV